MSNGISSFTCFFFFCSLAAIIDDSNNASMPTHEDVMETSTISQALNKVNPFYATILGQPFEGQGIEGGFLILLSLTALISLSFTKNAF